MFFYFISIEIWAEITVRTINDLLIKKRLINKKKLLVDKTIVWKIFHLNKDWKSKDFGRKKLVVERKALAKEFAFYSLVCNWSEMDSLSYFTHSLKQIDSSPI